MSPSPWFLTSSTRSLSLQQLRPLDIAVRYISDFIPSCLDLVVRLSLLIDNPDAHFETTHRIPYSTTRPCAFISPPPFLETRNILILHTYLLQTSLGRSYGVYHPRSAPTNATFRCAKDRHHQQSPGRNVESIEPRTRPSINSNAQVILQCIPLHLPIPCKRKTHLPNLPAPITDSDNLTPP